jgi:hypothetical protein
MGSFFALNILLYQPHSKCTLNLLMTFSAKCTAILALTPQLYVGHYKSMFCIVSFVPSILGGWKKPDSEILHSAERETLMCKNEWLQAFNLSRMN